jgi:hypothetical protein
MAIIQLGCKKYIAELDTISIVLAEDNIAIEVLVE